MQGRLQKRLVMSLKINVRVLLTFFENTKNCSGSLIILRPKVFSKIDTQGLEGFSQINHNMRRSHVELLLEEYVL